MEEEVFVRSQLAAASAHHASGIGMCLVCAKTVGTGHVSRVDWQCKSNK